MITLYVSLGAVAIVCFAGAIGNPTNNTTKENSPSQFFPIPVDSIRRMPPGFMELVEPRGGTPEFKQAPIPDDLTNFLKLMDNTGISPPTRSSIVQDLLRNFQPMAEVTKHEERPTTTPETAKLTTTRKESTANKPKQAEQASAKKSDTHDAKQETQPSSGVAVQKNDVQDGNLPPRVAAIVDGFIQNLKNRTGIPKRNRTRPIQTKPPTTSQKSEPKQEAKVQERGTQTEKNLVLSESEEPRHDAHAKPTKKDEHIITIPLSAPHNVIQSNTHPILGGHPRETEPQTHSKAPKTEARIIAVSPANLVNIFNNLNSTLPTIQDPRVYHVPVHAQEPAVREESGKPKPPTATVHSSESQSEEPQSESDEPRQETSPANEKVVAIELPGTDVTMTIRKLNEPKQETADTPIQKKSPQREAKLTSIPSLPEPSTFADALKDLRTQLEESKEDEEYQSCGSPPQSMPNQMAEIMAAFDSIIDDLRQKTRFPRGHRSPPQEKHVIYLPPPVLESANVALPLVQTPDLGLDEPERLMVGQLGNGLVKKEGIPFPIPEFAATLLGSELGSPKPDTEEEVPLIKELFPAFNKPEPTTTQKKEVFEIMYVKHLTFKLQIHMKVWHMFFVHVLPNPEAANNCTVVLGSVSKFYKQLSIDVQVVEQFRVLHRVAKMMAHNDENLKTFLAKDTLKSSIAGIKRLMKDMKNIRERQNEIVASLWENAMSHFDEHLAVVDNFFNGVLTDDEYAGTVLDFISDTTEITTYRKYLTRVASDFGTKFLRVDSEVTQIRTRRKIFRKPNPDARALMNDKIMKLYQKAFGQFLNFADSDAMKQW